MWRLALVALAIGCGGGGAQLPRDQITDPAQSLFNGYAKSAVDCYECHNGDGRGTKWGPPLAQRVPRLTDDQIRGVIVDGRGKMPAFRAKLTDAEVGELVTWLRARFGKNDGPGETPPAGPNNAHATGS